VQQSTLAGTGFTHQSDALTGGDLQIQPAEDDQVAIAGAVTFFQTDCADDWI
jgi:hypothetical protein